jgi:uncharacterized protein (TIGR02996 family)
MNQDEAFLQAIIDEPDDDALRLIYADWLMEQSNPRGEFIRLQVELTRPGLPAAMQGQYRARVRELLEANWEAWVSPLRQAIAAPPKWAEAWLTGGFVSEGLWKFRRGFVEELQLHLTTFAEAAERIYRLTPLRHLKVKRSFPPGLPAAHGLQERLTVEDVERFAACPYLAYLVALDFSDFYYAGLPDPETVAELASSPHLKRLTTLSLYGTNVGDGAIAALAQASWLGQLKWLNLAHTNMTGQGLRALCATPHVPALRWLRLANNPIGANLSALVGWEALRTVQTLGLKECGISNGMDVRDLIEVLQSIPLQTLDLDYNPIGASGLAQLLRGETLASASMVHLSACQLGDDGVDLLASSPALSRLETLSLARNDITDRGAQLLAESPCLTRLTSVGLEGNQITHQGAEVLRRSQRLKSVNLARNPCSET